MIKQHLQLLSEELDTKFSFEVDTYGHIVDLTILEEENGINIPKFTILVDKESNEYILSILDSPISVYFGSNIMETVKFFVSNDIEEIFSIIKRVSIENG